MDIPFINTIVLLGSIQGFLLSLFFMSRSKHQGRSNFYLALLLLATAFVLLQNYLFEIDLVEKYPIIYVLPFSIVTLIPISFYFLTQYLIEKEYKFKKEDYYIFIPLVIELILSLGNLFWYFIDKEFYINHKKIFLLIDVVEELMCILTCFVVFVILIKQLKEYHYKLLNNYAEVERKNLFWLRNVIIASFIIWGLWLGPYIWGISSGNYDIPLIFVWLAMSALVYWLGYFVLLRRDLFEEAKFVEEDIEEKGNELSSKTTEHYQRLLQLMEDKKLYNDPNLSMTILAEQTNLSNGYLSQIINQKEGKNFFDFVNGYRVEEVKQKLSDSEFDHYSILGIGLESGFKSKSTFNAVFKKMTGKTPSAYKKSL